MQRLLRQFRNSLAVLFLAAVCLAQTGTPLANESVRRVGNQLMCLCGCGSTVTSCNMLHCHFADPARLEIAAMLEAGRSDREILAAFEAKHGKRVLMKPPTQGFYLLGWVMPFVGLAIGLLLLWAIVKKFRAIPAPASRTAPPEVMARYRDRVESDTSNLD